MSKNSKFSLTSDPFSFPWYSNKLGSFHANNTYPFYASGLISQGSGFGQERFHEAVREKAYGHKVEEGSSGTSDPCLENQLTESNAHLRAQLHTLNDALETARVERRAQEASEFKLKRKLSNLMAHAPIGIIELNASGIVVEANDLAIDLLELPLEGMLWSDVIKQSFKPRPDDGFEVSLVNGKRVQVQTQSLDSLAGQIILLNDLTQTRQLQQALSRHERMAALGKTAATLAHQVRTPLCGALLYLSEVISDPQMPNQFMDRLVRAKGRLEHLERQVQQILMLSRGKLALAQVCSPDELFDNLKLACAPLQETFPSISLKKEKAKGPWYAKCNAEALIGALVNVIENAIQACHQAGEIEITMSVEKSTATPIQSLSPKSTLIFTIEDTGNGMSQEMLKKILEPFFTSRSDGTGLGLSVVKMVVDAHEGRVDIQSTLNKGTIVRIEIPLIHRVGSA